MMATDACIHPFPAGTSSLRRMAIEAGHLGFDSLVVPGADPGDYSGVHIIPAVVISENDLRKVSGLIRKRGDDKILILVDAGENSFNRGVLSQNGVHILRTIHRTPKNAFDHVAARIAAERGVAIDIDLSPLIREKGLIRQKVLSRYADIMRLYSRYRFPVTLSSNARTILDLRSPVEIRLLCTLFGMGKEDADQALLVASRLLSSDDAVKVIE